MGISSNIGVGFSIGNWNDGRCHRGPYKCMTHVKIEVNKDTKLVVAKDCLTNLILIEVITLMGNEREKIGLEVGV